MKRFLTLFISLSFLLISCDIKEEGISEERIIEVSNMYGNQLVTRYPVPFEAKDAAGNVLTANATFYVDGQAQNSNIIEFNQTGTYTVTASTTLDGQTITGAPYQVNVIEPRHTTKIMIEDYTGTWCTNCPRVTFKLEEAISQNHNIIPVGIHFNDPFQFNQAMDLINDYGIQGFPTPIVNRTLGFVWDENYSTLETEQQKSQALGLAINSAVNGNNLSIDVSVRFDMDMSKKNLNLVFYLTESGLFADQANGTSYYGGQDPIPNFEHKHTLRAALIGLYGETIPSGETEANQVYQYHFTGNIPSEVSNIDNCDIYAFVIDGNDKNAKLINIQKAAVGENKDFD